jgi:hypothetical protein
MWILRGRPRYTPEEYAALKLREQRERRLTKT